MKITARTLELRKVDGDQIATFVRHFPNGLDVSEDTCAAVALDFDWSLFAHLFLSPSGCQAYIADTNNARRRYDRSAATKDDFSNFKTATARVFGRMGTSRSD